MRAGPHARKWRDGQHLRVNAGSLADEVEQQLIPCAYPNSINTGVDGLDALSLARRRQTRKPDHQRLNSVLMSNGPGHLPDVGTEAKGDIDAIHPEHLISREALRLCTISS